MKKIKKCSFAIIAIICYHRSDIKKRRVDLRHRLKIVKTCVGHIGLYLRVLRQGLKSALRQINFLRIGLNLRSAPSSMKHSARYKYIHIYTFLCKIWPFFRLKIITLQIDHFSLFWILKSLLNRQILKIGHKTWLI